ncbi:hypothetical protein F2Q69_00026512 [Brassica cretica]|uniref:Uncharacterized protein n=1 Tax=Brassica cretica TaxID=69181 RepID=A0A8S9RVW1_BRACR|nr:hypothetical protein F2Q69_00026512 [Brassica cretica]
MSQFYWLKPWGPIVMFPDSTPAGGELLISVTKCGGITEQHDITCQGVSSSESTGSKMLSQLSDGLWGIIRSEDGMKSEIRETLQSVYAILSNPGGLQEGPSTREAGYQHRSLKVKPPRLIPI